MAKKSMIERDRKRIQLSNAYREKRTALLQQIQTAISIEEKLTLHRKLQRFPRNSISVRIRNRCSITGRPRGFFRDFGLSRHVLREYALEGLLPGVRKASW